MKQSFPLYAKGRTHRVIRERNGTYAAQRNEGGAGHKRGMVNGVLQPHYDPWQNTNRPTLNLLLALQQAGIEAVPS